MSEAVDDPSVNRGRVMQEGRMEDEGLGDFLLRLQAGQDNSSNNSNNSNNSDDDDEQEFHSPLKEPQTAPKATEDGFTAIKSASLTTTSHWNLASSITPSLDS
jgi:hypothetical protein